MAKNKKTQTKKSRLAFIVFGLMFACLGVYLVIQSFAAVVAIVSTSNKTSVEKGQSFIVTVGTDSGTEPVSIGHVRLTYDPTKVQYVSTDYTNTPFTNDTPDAATGAGFVQMSRYTTTPSAGNLVIGKATFKALASSGTIDIGVDRANSHVFSGATADDILGAVSGVAVEVKQPASGGAGGGTTPNNPTVPKGDNVVVTPKPTTSTGAKVKKTDHYLNRQFVGTSNSPADPVNIDTDNLTEGSYDLTAEAEAVDGTTEETTTQLTVTAPSFFTRFKLPLIASGVAIIAIGGFIVLKFAFAHSVPFYRTIGQQ